MGEISARVPRKLPAMELGLSKERAGQIDSAEDDALNPSTPAKPAALAASGKAITADEAAAAQKARQAKWDAEEAAAKKPKPGLLDKAKKLIGID